MRSATTGAPVPKDFTIANIYLIVFLIFCTLIQLHTGAHTSDLGRTADEAAHFVNSAMIAQYVLHGFGTNPVRYALDYYLHLPRVSIGHWPPVFHAVQAVWFLMLGTSPVAAAVLQAVVASAAATATAMLAGPRAGSGRAGVLVGGAYGLAVLMLPLVLNALSTVMLDVFLSVMVLASCLAWAGFARTGKIQWSIAFGLCASAAILTKGSAFGLALLPVLYVMMGRRWDLVLNVRTWAAAGIVLLLTGPWYVLTYKISAGGFNYEWGLAYSSLAAAAFTMAAFTEFGPLLLLGFLVGLGGLVRTAQGKAADEAALSCASGAVALFLFTLIVPADLQPRYLIAIAPLVVLVASVGFAMMTAMAARVVPKPAYICVAMLALNGLVVFRPLQAGTSAVTDAAKRLLASPGDGPLVLIAASSNNEGALIAAIAALDPARLHYVIRSSKALATSNFMGSSYQARFNSSEEVNDWIKASRINWLLVQDGGHGPAMLHTEQIAALADAGQPGWTLQSTLPSMGSRLRLFRLGGPAASPDELAAVLRQVAPDRVIGGN